MLTLLKLKLTIHSKSASSLDNNDDGVYTSSASNPYQYWSLRTRVNLLSRDFAFEYYANATIEQTIVRIETKSNIYTLEIRNQNLQISWYRISSLKSVSDTVSYHVSQKITVPPIPPILAVQINGMGIAGALFTPLLLIVLPFHPVPNPPNPLNPPTTSILIGKKILLKTVYNQNFLFGISYDSRDITASDRIADVEINALGCYLRKENYESKSILVECTLEVEGYGFDTRIET
ncbi:unnamed protein product [Rhizophagus irregularis]|nr:unnamed protein product [Rhizophagus irregularis]